MHYFRFNRGWVCADEVWSGEFIGDIVVDSGLWTMEVEIKVTKNDLIKGEANKTTGWKGTGKKKHNEWTKHRTNKFALCVPEVLAEVAQDWINKTNKRYGLYVYTTGATQTYGIITKKRALVLHKEYDSNKYLYKIAKRLSSTRAIQLSRINYKNE